MNRSLSAVLVGSVVLLAGLAVATAQQEAQAKPAAAAGGAAPAAGARPAGYTFGEKLATSPVTLKDLDALKRTLLLSDEDIKYLRMSREILADQTDAVLDVWYGFVAGTPELVYYFGNKETGKPEGEYLARVRARFAQWILDTAEANYDQRWLDYQHEIALRHNKAKKNQTDGAPSVAQINYRYIPALTIPVTTTLKPFLAKKGASAADVEKMHAAWVKAVLLQTILWSQPYVKDGQF